MDDFIASHYSSNGFSQSYRRIIWNAITDLGEMKEEL
jgi:hypothetical protein